MRAAFSRALTGIPFLRSLARSLGVLALTGVFTVFLVRLAPGFGLDERLTDATLGAETRAQIGEQARAGANRWGTSSAYGQPVAELISRRWKPTAIAIGNGLAAAWALALGLVLLNFRFRLRAGWALSDACAALLVSAPIALFGLAAFLYRLPVGCVIAAAVFPMLYRFLRGRLQATQSLWPSLGAEARGLSRWRVAVVYVLAPARAELAMLGAVSLKWALSAAIPAEVFADEPGLGQLVWKAAEARDLALMIPLTLLAAGAVQAAQCVASLAAPLAATKRSA